MFDEDFGLSTSQILQKLSSQLGGSYDGGEVKVTAEGRDYFFFIFLPVRGGGQGNLIGRPSFFELKTQIPFPHPDFMMIKSGLMDLLAEQTVGSSDFQIGDPAFDSKIHIKLHNNDWGSRFFAEENTKQSILDLLFQGFDLIRSEDGYLKIVKYLPVGTSYPTAELISNAIEKSENIITAIPGTYDMKDALELSFQETEEAKNRRSGCFLILIMLIVLPIIFWMLTRSIGLYIAKSWQGQ
jgi:hypothetical protein